MFRNQCFDSYLAYKGHLGNQTIIFTVQESHLKPIKCRNMQYAYMEISFLKNKAFGNFINLFLIIFINELSKIFFKFSVA